MKSPSSCDHEYVTIETRSAPEGTRRRKRCKHCHHRITTYEVSADFYAAAQQNQSVVDQLRALLPNAGTICKNCIHGKGGACSYDLPEYNTNDAYDCNLFCN